MDTENSKDMIEVSENFDIKSEEAPSIREEGIEEGAAIGAGIATFLFVVGYIVKTAKDKYGPFISAKLAELKGTVQQKLFPEKEPPATIDKTASSEPDVGLDVSEQGKQG